MQNVTTFCLSLISVVKFAVIMYYINCPNLSIIVNHIHNVDPPEYPHLCIVGCRRAKKSCAAFQATPLPLGQWVSPWNSFPRKGHHLQLLGRYQLQLSHIGVEICHGTIEACWRPALQVLMSCCALKITITNQSSRAKKILKRSRTYRDWHKFTPALSCSRSPKYDKY